MSWQITGQSGVLLVGGRPAAVLGKWTATVVRPGADAPAGWTLTAQVAEQDAYLLGLGRPYTLSLDGSRGRLRWRDLPPERVRLSGQQVTITGEGTPEDGD